METINKTFNSLSEKSDCSKEKSDCSEFFVPNNLYKLSNSLKTAFGKVNFKKIEQIDYSNYKEITKEELTPRTQFFKSRSDKNIKMNSFIDSNNNTESLNNIRNNSNINNSNFKEQTLSPEDIDEEIEEQKKKKIKIKPPSRLNSTSRNPTENITPSTSNARSVEVDEHHSLLKKHLNLDDDLDLNDRIDNNKVVDCESQDQQTPSRGNIDMRDDQKSNRCLSGGENIDINNNKFDKNQDKLLNELDQLKNKNNLIMDQCEDKENINSNKGKLSSSKNLKNKNLNKMNVNDCKDLINSDNQDLNDLKSFSKQKIKINNTNEDIKLNDDQSIGKQHYNISDNKNNNPEINNDKKDFNCESNNRSDTKKSSKPPKPNFNLTLDFNKLNKDKTPNPDKPEVDKNLKSMIQNSIKSKMKESSKKLPDNALQPNTSSSDNINSQLLNPNPSNSSSSVRKRSFNRGQQSNRKSNRDNSVTSERSKLNPDINMLNSMIENTQDEDQEFIAEPMAGMDIDDENINMHVKRDVNLKSLRDHEDINKDLEDDDDNYKQNKAALKSNRSFDCNVDYNIHNEDNKDHRRSISELTKQESIEVKNSDHYRSISELTKQESIEVNQSIYHNNVNIDSDNQESVEPNVNTNREALLNCPSKIIKKETTDKYSHLNHEIYDASQLDDQKRHQDNLDEENENDDTNNNIDDGVGINVLDNKSNKELKDLEEHQQNLLKSKIKYQVFIKPELEGDLNSFESLNSNNFNLKFLTPSSAEGLVQCTIKRERGLFGTTFKMQYSKNQHFLLNAQKASLNSTPQQTISAKYDDQSKSNNPGYLGKIRSNFEGNKWVFYSDGVDPTKNKGSTNEKVREELGAVYQGNLDKSQPLAINVGIPQATQDGRIPFMPHNKRVKLLDNMEGRDTKRMMVFKNKMPQYDEFAKRQLLDFRGRVKLASVKNFQLTLSNPGIKQDEVLLQFGKIEENTFNLDFRYPFSYYQAFCICLSSFENKISL